MKEGVKSFYELNVWIIARELVSEIYKKINNFPKKENYNLCDQMRRSSISVTSNIAEGFSRYYFKDKLRFYYIARGSITELQSQLIISKDLKYINKEEYINMFKKAERIRILLNGLIKSNRLSIK